MQDNITKQELTKAIREGTVEPERSGSYWTEDERKQLVTYFELGHGITDTALMLCRSEIAIVQQLLTMGLLTTGKRRAYSKPACECLCEKCKAKHCTKGVCPDARKLG